MKKKIVVLLVFVLTVSLFTACGGGGGSTKSEDDPVVVYTPDIFNTMIPYETTANSDQMVFDQVYETLAITQDDGSVKGCLAKDWTISDDGLVYTFNLVQDAKFHNGEDMKASDVVFSFNKFMETAAKKNFVEMIKSVEAVDDYTVKITLSKVTPLFLVYTNEIPVLNEKFVTENEGKFNDKACGTGPYELVSIDFATAAKLTRFEDYRLGPANIGELELRYVGDSSTATVQFETGEMDIIKLEPTQLENVKDNDDFTIKEVQTLKTAIFAINTTVEPLDNKLVRQALNYACDKQSIIDVAYEGYAEPARLQASDVNCFGVDFSDSEEVTYDPEKAKELLAEAGYPDGLDFGEMCIRDRDISVFYLNEDQWDIAYEIYGTEQVQMEPNYYIAKLPGEEDAEFFNSIPYTPKTKKNMTALFVARNDGDNYGELVLYQFPKSRTIYGPEQIEAQIDQNTEISKEFSLWNSSGTKYSRGNMFIIPINSSILYVEPVYLEATNSSIPEVKRIIVAYGDKIAYEETLAECLVSLFGDKAEEGVNSSEGGGQTEEGGGQTGGLSQDELIDKAVTALEKAQSAQQSGDWAAYGEYLEELEDVLSQLAE